MRGFIGGLPDFQYFYIVSIDLVIFTASELPVALPGRKDSGHQDSQTFEESLQ